MVIECASYRTQIQFISKVFSDIGSSPTFTCLLARSICSAHNKVTPPRVNETTPKRTRMQPHDDLTFTNNPISSIKFSSLDEAEEWYNTRGKDLVDAFRIPRESLSNYSRTRNSNKTESKVLVCHDFKNNYQEGEDENPLGYFPHPSGQHYYIQFPSLVDVFVYFSHHRISVPPVSWINSLHRQGIPVLGTLIFEGTDYFKLDQLLDKTEQGEFKYSEILTELVRHYGFDGWLINVESHFSSYAKAQELVLFDEALKSSLHRFVPGSRLIWYDSFITSKNRVFYQNAVNEWNYDNYLSSDLFFTNYWWNEEDLKKNILNIGLQGVKQKLFVGIDVWGRGSKVGNGGFETGVAINFVKRYSSNVALFSPSWTYENFDEDQFLLNDRKFWIGDETSDETGGSVATYISHYTAPVYCKDQNVKFYTNFSVGEGSKFRVFAHTVFNNNWVNGNIQLPTPVIEDEKRLEIYNKEAFNGGSSLKIAYRNSVLNDKKASVFSLFSFKTDIFSNNLNVSLSFKYLTEIPSNSTYQLEIKFYIERRYRSTHRVRDGSFKLPLAFSNNNWKYIETTFALPRLQVREHFVLEGVQVRWVENVDEMSSSVSNSDINGESWVLVPQDRDSKIVHELLIGDLLIEGIKNEVTIAPIFKISKKADSGGKELLVAWDGNVDVLFWFIYINAKFLGVSHTPLWRVQRGDKLRVDIFTRSGKVIPGKDIFI